MEDFIEPAKAKLPEYEDELRRRTEGKNIHMFRPADELENEELKHEIQYIVDTLTLVNENGLIYDELKKLQQTKG